MLTFLYQLASYRGEQLFPEVRWQEPREEKVKEGSRWNVSPAHRLSLSSEPSKVDGKGMREKGKEITPTLPDDSRLPLK